MTDTTEQARAHFVAGNAHFEAGSLEAARTSFEAALALAPGRTSVLANLGALEEVFAAVRARLRAGGCFAFSVERHDGEEDLRLLPSKRYAHAPAYLTRLARQHGFLMLRQWEAALRQDQNEAINGLYLHLGVDG